MIATTGAKLAEMFGFTKEERPKDGDGDGLVFDGTEQERPVEESDESQNQKILAWAKNRFNDESKAVAFANWFGDSKVVDQNGNPLVVYHGTPADFDEFSPSKRGTNQEKLRIGYFLTNDPEEAGNYAEGETGNIKPVFVSMQNPLIERDETGSNSPIGIWESYKATRIKTALSNGHDGIIISSGDQVLYVPFNPNQIKSATGNAGTFDPSEADIRKSLQSFFGFSKDAEPKDGDGDGLVFDGTEQERPVEKSSLSEIVREHIRKKVWSVDTVTIEKHIEMLRATGRIDQAEEYQAQLAEKIGPTKTKSFKAWFGDWESDPANASKVVDADGNPQDQAEIAEPKPVYHGTGKGGWNEFEPRWGQATGLNGGGETLLFGPGFYFTEDPTVAESYSKIGASDRYSTDATKEQLSTVLDASMDAYQKDLQLWIDADMEADATHVKSSMKGIQELKQKLGSIDDHQNNQDLLRAIHNYAQIQNAEDLSFMLPDDLRSTIGKTPTSEVKKVYLKIRNPFDMDAVVDPSIADKLKPILTTETERELRDRLSQGSVYGHELPAIVGSKTKLNEQLQSVGYDGLTHIGGRIMGGGKEHRVWIAFTPTQIKAVDNEGTFDSSNPDIRKSLSLLFGFTKETAKDGDSDGLVFDGTPEERPVEDDEQNDDVSAVAKRLRIPEQAVVDIVNQSADELKRRDIYFPGSNSTEPTTDFERFPIGSVKIDSFHSDPTNAYVNILTEFDPKDLKTSEAEDGIKKRDKSYPLYVEWAKQGIEPPPISTGETWEGNGTVVSSNRRRVLAAQEAGSRSIKAWHSPINKETGLPLKYGDVKSALTQVYSDTLTRDQAESVIATIRAGDQRSKNGGVIRSEEVKTPHRKVSIPLSEIPRDVIEHLESSTDKNRVDRYSKTDIKTPVVLFKRRRTKDWAVSDGGHRILAAIKRGDDTIDAYVPDDSAKDPQTTKSLSGWNDTMIGQTESVSGKLASFFGFTKESSCGANGPGGQGFQPGNTCGAEDGDGGDDYNPDKENMIPEDGPSQHSDMLHNIKTDPTKQDRAELLQFAKDVATFKIRKDSLLRRAIKELTTDPTKEDRGRAFKYVGDVLTLKPAADFITGKNRGPNPAGDDLRIITGGVKKVVNATVGNLVRLVGRSIADSRASGPAIPDRVNNHRVPMMVRSFTKAVEADGQDQLVEQITDEVLRRAGDYTDADVVQEAILDVMEEVLSGEFPETEQTVAKAGGILGTTGSTGGFLQSRRPTAVESDWLNHEFDPDDYDPPERDR